MNERLARRIATAVVIVTAGVLWFLGGRTAVAQEDYVYGVGDTLAAIEQASIEHGVSYRWLRSIVYCESRFYPYARGRAGEIGPVQLHPRGELRTFYRWGYDNPNSPYQAVAFLAQRLNQGAARAWSCA